MEQRVKITTGSLQQRFHNIYKNLFVKNSVVLSLPHIFQRGNPISRINECFKIKQKLPGKMYIGSNKIKQNTTINSIICFNPVLGNFQNYEPGEIIRNKKRLEQIIQKYLNINGIKEGLEINILSEYQRGHGMIFLGSFFVSIAVLILLLAKKLTTKEVEDYNFVTSNKIKSVYDLRFKINHEFFGITENKATGMTIFSSLCKSSFPILQDFRKKIFLNNYGLEKSSHMPIDYGIISYGLPHNIDHITGDYNNIKNEFKKTSEYFDKINSKKSGKIEVSLYIINQYLNLSIVEDFKKIFTNPFDKSSISCFIKQIKNRGIFNTFLEKEEKILVDIYYLFDKLRLFKDEEIGLIPLSTSKIGGSFLFALEYEKSRETMKNLIKDLKLSGYGQAEYIYLSREEGLCDDGLIIEQYLDEGVFSKHIQEGNVSFENTTGKKYLDNYNSIVKKEKDILILDKISRKIFFNGKRLTHNDICSQSGTIELLDILTKNIGKIISNRQLPSSSYSKNKNEMLGKIILPLQKIYKKFFKKTLPIKCTGSIYDFNIIMKKDKVCIGIIDNI